MVEKAFALYGEALYGDDIVTESEICEVISVSSKVQAGDALGGVYAGGLKN